MPFVPFFVANILGAVTYLPLAVAVGYAIGYGFGDYVTRFQRLVGKIEHIVLIAIVIFAIIVLGWRALRTRGVLPRPIG